MEAHIDRGTDSDTKRWSEWTARDAARGAWIY